MEVISPNSLRRAYCYSLIAFTRSAKCFLLRLCGRLARSAPFFHRSVMVEHSGLAVADDQPPDPSIATAAHLLSQSRLGPLVRAS